MPLAAAHPLALQQLPEAPGVFRLIKEGANDLLEVGLAEKGLRLEIERLARRIRLAQPPASSDTLAARLWRLHRREGSSFLISGTRAEGCDLHVVWAEMRGDRPTRTPSRDCSTGAVEFD